MNKNRAAAVLIGERLPNFTRMAVVAITRARHKELDDGRVTAWFRARHYQAFRKDGTRRDPIYLDVVAYGDDLTAPLVSDVVYIEPGDRVTVAGRLVMEFHPDRCGDRAVSISIQMSGARASIKPTLPSMEVAVVAVQEVRESD